MKINTITLSALLGIMILINACSKGWLDEKPSKALVVPETLKDLQAILDNNIVFNGGFSYLGFSSTDYIYYSEDDLGSILDVDREMYTWSKELNLENIQLDDWVFFYRMIGTANLVLEGLDKFSSSKEVKEIQGQARFFRGMAYYYLTQAYCKPYLKETVNKEAGIPIRLKADVSHLEKRSTLQQAYDQILSDLTYASNTLAYDANYTTRASKTAALAMLAKVNLVMGQFNDAKKYADSVLMVKPALIDFNNQNLVSHDLEYKFPYLGNGNPEIIFFAQGFTGNQYSMLGNYMQVSPSFYNSYSDKDRRKEFFFTESAGRMNFVGSYSGNYMMFQGISTNEMYFIRSECNARLNNIPAAQDDLNLILKNRYLTGEAPIIAENNKTNLLKIIFSERTKEFPRFSNIWWEDLRRLNLEPEFQRTLHRNVNGKEYTLPPNDPRYIFPIPNKEIMLSGIEQNQR